MKFVPRVLCAGAAGLAMLVSATASANTNASLTVIHGINGGDLALAQDLNVDVFVNGARAIDNFKFKNVVGPLSLPAGTYSVEVRLDLDGVNGSADDTTVIGPANIPLAPRENATVVAHLNAAGAPTASKFTNNVQRLIGSTTRLSLHHTAAAPEVDVYARFGPIWARIAGHLANGERRVRTLLAGNTTVAVTPAGTLNSVLGPATLNLQRRTTYLVYVVGSITSTRNSLELIIVPVKS